MRETALHLHDDRLVLLIVLTTTPCKTRFGISISQSLSRSSLVALQLLDAGDVPTDLADAPGVLKLAGRALEAEVELLLLQVQELVRQLVRRYRVEVGGLCFDFMIPSSLGNALDEARLDRKLGRAEAQGLAGDILRHAVDLEHDTARLHLGRPEFRSALARAIRTSVGFDDTGTSGKMRIHTRPARFMARVMARGGPPRSGER